jgi:hypothetical protein
VAEPFSASALTRILARIESRGVGAARTGLIGVGDAIVKQARTNASNGSHAYGTPTPARPGEGPARISGTLRNSITRTAVVKSAEGWETKVGIRPGQVPNYRRGRHRTPSSQYGKYLETGLRNGSTYPFLKPATQMAAIQAAVVYRQVFSDVNWL